MSVYQYNAAQLNADCYNCNNNHYSQASDIVMVLDRSASMAGEPLENLQEAAKTFINIMVRNNGCNSVMENQMGYGNRIGIVSFADHATINTPLVTSAEALYNAVDALCAGGKTNHAEAFTRAVQVFENASNNQRVIVMFTDGRTTYGVSADRIARAIRKDGVTIYAIGLAGENDVHEDALNEWANDPNEEHVAIAPTSKELKALFADLANTLSKRGNKTETAEETSYNNNCYQKKHCRRQRDNDCDNDDDNDSRQVTMYAEDCPNNCDLRVENCTNALVVDAGETQMQSQGRIVQLDVTVRNVCPGKRVALGCILTEVDDEGNEYHRGTKTMTIPAHNRSSCRDVRVRRIHFVLPEDISVAENNRYGNSNCNCMCRQRNFKARFIAHHIDSEYQCCEGEVTLQ